MLIIAFARDISKENLLILTKDIYEEYKRLMIKPTEFDQKPIDQGRVEKTNKKSPNFHF